MKVHHRELLLNHKHIAQMCLRGDESRQSEWSILYGLVLLQIDEDPLYLNDHGSAGLRTNRQETS